ncbi:nitroreductase family protein [Granulicella sp. L46]|jgi:hypothetical protein|uniref:nitroreductase family protein n=1 Tax=Granulicella sp. L46 TaxID=1641865 RepID=UPI00131CA228|nr:nitroreductase family protein [Granulicella sp. L46]
MARISPQHLVAQMITSASARANPPCELSFSVPLPGLLENSISLPATISEPRRSLLEVIHARRSGGLRPGPIPVNALSALLSTNFDVLLQKAFGPHSPSPAIIPILWNVTGIPGGVFRYRSEDHRLLPIPTNDSTSRLHALFTQREHQSASAALVFLAPMSAWLARGERGYRASALQIGMITDAIYLAAELEGLTYSASGGFPPASMDAALGLDGVTYTAFFSFVIGGLRR